MPDAQVCDRGVAQVWHHAQGSIKAVVRGKAIGRDDRGQACGQRGLQAIGGIFDGHAVAAGHTHPLQSL